MSEERFNYEVDDATRFVDNLKDRVHDLYDKNEELKEEVKRLNNIINELENYVIDREERSWDDNGAYDDVLDKLQELKGVDKE